ncbi:hypothetical protein ACFODT_14095 [Vibrio zhugei]|uniref:Uncharacterized protein n=1 Tax=Vibrio zhugei TaxID=2479546 RepID=A0ABV7CDZ6_9VIBR|nr:hypothetical protein [Vibrio zhugei]
MLHRYIVRSVIVSLLLLTMTVNVLYILPMIVLLNTHFHEFFGR